jgi:hypothetical protein
MTDGFGWELLGGGIDGTLFKNAEFDRLRGGVDVQQAREGVAPFR